MAIVASGAARCAANRVSVTPETGAQAALDAARPGDVIVLAPGVYYESLRMTNSGTAAKPIVIKAERGGTATISGEDPVLARAPLLFERVEGDLYKAEDAPRVNWLLANGRVQWPYPSLADLKAFRTREQWRPPEGYFLDKRTLYVRLLRGANPGKARMEIPRNPPQPNLAIDAHYVHVEGLRLHLAGAATALTCAGDAIEVRDCYIEGAKNGISKGGGEDFLVEHCEFSGFPFYEWKRASYGFWPYGFINFMGVSGPRATVRHNLAYDFFDGIGFGSDPSDGSIWSECHHNVLMRGLDDAMEFDSSNPLNFRIHHNVIIDSWIAFALSPVQGGGLVIDHNIAYRSPEAGNPHATFFKLNNPWANKREIPTQGFQIIHNTLVDRSYELQERKPDSMYYWGGIHWGGDNWYYRDAIFENNLIHTGESQPWNLTDISVSRRNLHAGPRILAAHAPHFLHARDAGFAETKRMDFRLNADSPAVDRGIARPGYEHPTTGAAPDLGAIEFGTEWEFPRPGPRWADAEHATRRPRLPASFDPRCAGLE